jgi:hypothetical protein
MSILHSSIGMFVVVEVFFFENLKRIVILNTFFHTQNSQSSRKLQIES